MSEASGQGAVASTGTNGGESQSLASGKRVYTPGQGQQQAATNLKEEVPTYKGTKHRVKLEGEEREVDYDDLVKGYQVGQVSTQALSRG